MTFLDRLLLAGRGQMVGLAKVALAHTWLSLHTSHVFHFLTAGSK